MYLVQLSVYFVMSCNVASSGPWSEENIPSSHSWKRKVSWRINVNSRVCTAEIKVSVASLSALISPYTLLPPPSSVVSLPPCPQTISLQTISQWMTSGWTTSPSRGFGLMPSWRDDWSQSSSMSTARCSSLMTTRSSSVSLWQPLSLFPLIPLSSAGIDT